MVSKAAITVAIDGPAGAGKSTVSKLLALRLGLALVDTGAMYRSVALVAHKRGIALEHEELLCDITASLDLRFAFDGEKNRVFVNGEDVSGDIRTGEISESASIISSYAGVRSNLLDLQRRMAQQMPGAVLEGRDIGTVVLPNATVKFFLTAGIETRARRRFNELVAKGESPNFEELLAAETQRDRRDTERATAPLRQADDAILVDSTSLSTEDVVELMLQMIRDNVSKDYGCSC